MHASWRGSCTGRYRVAQAAGVIYIVREECSQDQIEELDDVVDSTVDGGEGGGPTAEAMLAMYGVEGWTRLGGGGKPTQSISLYGVASSHQLAALLHNGLNGWLATAAGAGSGDETKKKKKAWYAVVGGTNVDCFPHWLPAGRRVTCGTHGWWTAAPSTPYSFLRRVDGNRHGLSPPK